MGISGRDKTYNIKKSKLERFKMEWLDEWYYWNYGLYFYNTDVF
jgi:hypothetical protein